MIAVRSHIEGKHKELTKQLVTKMDSENGRVNAYYVKGPYSKELDHRNRLGNMANLEKSCPVNKA